MRMSRGSTSRQRKRGGFLPRVTADVMARCHGMVQESHTV